MRGLRWYCTAIGHRVLSTTWPAVFLERKIVKTFTVKFSRDEKYLAYGGRDEIITLDGEMYSTRASGECYTSGSR